MLAGEIEKVCGCLILRPKNGTSDELARTCGNAFLLTFRGYRWLGLCIGRERSKEECCARLEQEPEMDHE